MFLTTLYVALGGAIGAAMRFVTGRWVLSWADGGAIAGVPLPILAVNILGSFLMGVFVVFAAQKGLSHWQPFVMTGILGGFTTFSAFSLEAVTLMERGQWGAMVSYVLLSVGLSVLALIAGIALARVAWA